MTDYLKACEYVGSIPKFAAKTELNNTRFFLSVLGNPTGKYKNVHIAGTNGKGSVSKMIALMLEEAGYRVGLFTSPHLVKVNERIAVNGEEISDEDFALYFEQVKKTVEDAIKGEAADSDGKAETAADKENSLQAVHPAYFEFLFLMAAKYFEDQHCDYVVWETGLGGRLDATNTTQPEVSVITSIGLDHMMYLGDTIEQIAGEKAGIIKEGVPVIFNTGEETADSVIEKTAKEKNAKTINAATAILSEAEEKLIEEFAEKQTALYQKDNAKTAVLAFKELFPETESSERNRCMKAGLEAFFWPGRMEKVAPGFVIDGAHNENAVIRFAQSAKALMEQGGYEKISLIFAVCEDKDYESIIRTLCQNLRLEKVYVAELDTARKTPAETVVGLFQKYRPAEETRNNYGFTNLASAVKAAEERDEKTLLMAVGSLYLVGEIKALGVENTWP